MNLEHISAKLSSIISRHEAGEPVYREMAERMESRYEQGALYQDETPDPEPEDDSK